MELAKKCVGDERCVAMGRRLLWNISPIYPKLGRVRHWFTLMFVLAGAWVECRAGGTGQIAGAQTDVQGSSFEVVMKRCRSKSLYIPLSVSWHRDKGRAAVATLMVLHMGYYSKWNKSSNLTYIGDKLKASVHCSVCSIWFIVRYNRFGRSCCVLGENVKNKPYLLYISTGL